MEKYTIPVKGMTCASCVARVEKVVGKFDHLQNVAVNFANEKLTFESEHENVDLHEIAGKVKEYGYELELPNEDHSKHIETNAAGHQHDEESYSGVKKDFLVSLIFTVPIFLISMLYDFEFFREIWTINHDSTNKILLLLTTPIMFIPGKRFFVIFWNNLKHFTAEMNSLVAIGTGAAFLYSTIATLFPGLLFGDSHIPHVYFETAAVIITLILLGRWLEDRAKKKTNSAVKKLLKLRPDKALVKRNGKEEIVSYSDLRIGDIVIVKPGENIPTDGEIISGSSNIDESMITGESMPVEKSIGSKVIGGTFNTSGTFNFKVEKLGDNSVLGKIIKMVEEAQGSKAPIQKLADKIASVFVPVVILVAILTFLAWFIFPESLQFDRALINFVAVLIIACPCALGLATPTAIMVGTGLGANKGILIKNGEILELMREIKTVVLDKTGTITEGKPKVSDIIPIDYDEKELLKVIGSIENKSEHPLSKAIVDKSKEYEIEFNEPDNFNSKSGFGLSAELNGKQYLIGNKKLMEENSVELSQVETKYNDYSNEGKTVIFAAENNKLIGLLTIEDPVKESSKSAIEKLKKNGLKVIMMTGDNDLVAKSLAAKIGIDDYFANVSPEDKSGKVKELQTNGSRIAMVGDGINDAPALAQADVGIAIGTGTDIAIETSDVTLVKGDLNDVLHAINLSQKTIRTVKQNLFWAFIYNTLGIPLAALGLLNPMIAALAMSFSSVSVVTNSLRLKRAKI
ncbi:lead, cadmium, zinc and mercury transporting atpase [hydrocarbon metagenome]|uniref:Lead, cadmium, zinc and mercury transporting atpase n=1 Tax=hydrocarbon metagenome TaxID=938273 RepID=A0A0W8FVR6_9ZZZZ